MTDAEPVPTDEPAPPDNPDDDTEPVTDPDEVADAGFYGTRIDPTPPEHYTFGGQAEGKPVPETDEDAAEEARRASRS